MVYHLFIRFVQFYYNAQDHCYDLVILFALALVVSDHRRQDWYEKIIHHSQLDGQSLFYDHLKSCHEDLAIFLRHCL